MIPELPEDLSPILRHLEAAYPNEGCGLVFRGADGTLRVQPMQNAYDRYHAVDPQTYPRTARTAYTFDGREHLRVSREAEARGETLTCIFHSHADVGAYFSAEDEAMAAPGGEPLYPGVAYLVVAVDKGRTTAAKIFRWVAGRFEAEELALLLREETESS